MHNNTKPIKNKNKPVQPQPVTKIICPRCKELLIKVFPYAMISNPAGQTTIACGKCANNPKLIAQLSSLKSGVA